MLKRFLQAVVTVALVANGQSIAATAERAALVCGRRLSIVENRV